ncbi:MAG: type II secretion system protein [Candidatus Microsaccharimonas sp.]
MKKWAQKQTGFTIVELLIVVVTIAILAAITIVAYNGIQAKSRDAARDSAAKSIRTALELYKSDNADTYPNACGTVNTGCSSAQLAGSLVPKYIASIPSDPVAGTTIDYVVGTGQIGYGLLVNYQSKPKCKFLVGSSTNSGWWGSGIPVC